MPSGPPAPLISGHDLPAESGHQAPPTPRKRVAPVLPSLLMSELGLLPTGAGSWPPSSASAVVGLPSAFPSASWPVHPQVMTSSSGLLGAGLLPALQLNSRARDVLAVHAWVGFFHQCLRLPCCLQSAWRCIHRSHPVLTTWVTPPLRACLRCET